MSEPVCEYNTVIAEHLAQLRKAIAECFALGSNPKFELFTQFEAVKIGSRLIDSSVRLAGLIARENSAPKETTHRVVVERVEGGGGTPPAASQKQFMGSPDGGGTTHG